MELDEFVGSKTKITIHDNMHKYSFQPGNGYKYEILAANLYGPLTLGILGGIETGYLVVNGFTGMSHLFSLNNYLHTSYVKEKLFFPDPLSLHVHAVTALIAWVLSRDTDATIESMELDPVPA
jgi:hypothetical protein